MPAHNQPTLDTLQKNLLTLSTRQLRITNRQTTLANYLRETLASIELDLTTLTDHTTNHGQLLDEHIAAQSTKPTDQPPNAVIDELDRLSRMAQKQGDRISDLQHRIDDYLGAVPNHKQERLNDTINTKLTTLSDRTFSNTNAIAQHASALCDHVNSDPTHAHPKP